MNKPALLILFNHNYEKNLDILEQIYSDRFSFIYFLMPFYQGNRRNVIAVYENSYYFQGYIAQALSKLSDHEFEHYLIIGDDLLLNPLITENNYKNFFEVNDNTAFIPGMFLLNNKDERRPNRPLFPFWGHDRSAFNFQLHQKGIEAFKYLPDYTEAKNLLKNHGFNFTPNVPKQMFYSKPVFKFGDSWKRNYYRLKLFAINFKYFITETKIPYPLVGSYSDIVIIPRKHAHKFALYSGIFSSMKLFVEIALPSALAYSVPTITSEEDLKFKGITHWEADEVNDFEEMNKGSINYLFENFPKNCLYVHPIKFSKWKL